MSEFEVIEKHFRSLTMGRAGTAELLDDAATIEIPDGYELVITSDTLNEGVHFFDGEDPENIARKALRVNLSDLVAMAATPLCYQLNIAFPEKPSDKWLESFSKALHEDNRLYNIYCSGGDTTSIKGGGLSISITAMGIVPKGCALRRSGAKAGDFIVITGCVGDAALGLKTLQESHEQKLYEDSVSRYLVPQPRIEASNIIRRYAGAATDISDGLIADCLHIAKASGLGAEIDIEKIKFSQCVNRAIDNRFFSIEEAVTGGDDYELILSVSDVNLESLMGGLRKINLNPMVIGRFLDSKLGVSFVNSGTLNIDISNLGWQHF